MVGGKPTPGMEGGLKETEDGDGREDLQEGIFRQCVDSGRVRR